MNLASVYYNEKQYDKAFDVIEKVNINCKNLRYNKYLIPILAKKINAILIHENDLELSSYLAKKITKGNQLYTLYQVAKKNNSTFETYFTWLKLFPFELSIFKNLKAHFEKQLPIVKGKSDYNPYTGLTAFKTVSQTELIQNLINTTNSILSKVDTSVMVEKNFNDQANIHNLEILNKLQ